MTITTFSSRTFARDAAAIKRATAHGPVFITDRGKPALAVLSINEYHRLTGEQKAESLLDAMLTLPSTPNVELELPSRQGSLNERRVPEFGSSDKQAG